MHELNHFFAQMSLAWKREFSSHDPLVHFTDIPVRVITKWCATFTN